MKKIMAIALLLLFLPSYSFAGTTATVTVGVTVLPGQNDISVDTSNVNFGSVTGTVSNRRFVAGPITVRYFAGTNPWTIRVYTANPSHIAGLIGVTDSNKSIPLKAWCDNYGPRLHPIGQPPNEENTYFWNGYDFNGNSTKTDVITDGSISEVTLGFDVNGNGTVTDVGLGTVSQPVSEDPSWLRVPDYNDMVSGNPFTWRRLVYSGAELNSDGFPVFLAVDVTGVTPQEYRTAALTFQIINE